MTQEAKLSNRLPVALTVAGSDSGGGAGIQADLKTFSALDVFGTSVITAVTAQNLTQVRAIEPIRPAVVKEQLLAVLQGFPVKAIKIGMLFTAGIIKVIAGVLREFRHIPLVVDPVFAATSGGKLIQDQAIEALSSEIFPLASLITPNMPEAEILQGVSLETREDLEKTAKDLFTRFAVPVLLKGGHLTDQASDVLYSRQGMKVFPAKSISGVNTHGSGCTLSAAIAAFMARGLPLTEAVMEAKVYITASLENAVEIDARTRVIDHFWFKKI